VLTCYSISNLLHQRSSFREDADIKTQMFLMKKHLQRLLKASAAFSKRCMSPEAAECSLSAARAAGEVSS